MHKENQAAVNNTTQCYQYDTVGNIENEARCVGSLWIRNYEYETTNNRLKTTQIGTQVYMVSLSCEPWLHYTDATLREMDGISKKS
jgi:hypothetical protein